MDMITNGTGFRSKLRKVESRKWSATGPNDSILRPPLEKSLSLRTADVRNTPVVEKEHLKICSITN